MELNKIFDTIKIYQIDDIEGHLPKARANETSIVRETQNYCPQETSGIIPDRRRKYGLKHFQAVNQSS